MTIVTTRYRPKRAPRKKRKQPAIVSRIVTPAPLKPIKGPVIRLGSVDQSDDTTGPKRSAIVEPKRARPAIFDDAPDMAAEEHQRRGDLADALFREIVRQATGDEDQ